MRRQEIIAVLTEEEKQNLVRNSFRLLCDLQVFDDTKTLVTQLKRLLVQLYKNEPDACFHKTADGYHSASNIDYIDYYVAYKQIADLYYFADGKLTTSGLKNVEMPPWEPSEKTRQELEQKNNKCREDYNKRQSGQALEEEAKANIKSKEKSFWNSLLKHRHLFLKYQMCKYLKKKFTVPKRFNNKSISLWQLAEQLKTAVTFSSEQQKQIANTIDDINTAISQLFYSHDYCSRISVLSFNSQEDIAAADRQKCLDYYDNDVNRNKHGWLQQVRFWHEDYITITDDPDIEGKNLNIRIATLVNIIYTLQCYGEKTGGDIKDFLTVLGIIKPQED